MDNKKNGIPKLRFPGFTGAWEQRKLGDLAEIVRGASPRPISDPKWFDDNSDIGWLRISDVTNQNGRIYYLEQHISKLGQEKTRVITEPHLLLSIAATVGKPLINYIKTGVHDGFLIFLNPKFDLEYMYQWLEMFRPKWNKYGQPGSQVNLNSNLVRKQKIALPSREEQQRISSFLKQLDSLIALHQRKLEHLQEQKKGLLQKMFPKNGETVPEVRFPGFTDAWEQRRLGEVVEYNNGSSYEQLVKLNGQYELITLKSVSSDGKLVSSGKFVSGNFKTLEKNDLVMILSEQAKGMLGVTSVIPCDDKYVLNQRVASLSPYNNVISDFLKEAINTKQAFFERLGAGTKVQNISRKQIENFVLTIPTKFEQQKIGKFLRQFDSLIALHQRKLEHLELMKKGLLQQMFV